MSDVSRHPAKGDHVSLTTLVENCKLQAVGWKDKTVKMFISTCGTTLPGQPHQKY